MQNRHLANGFQHRHMARGTSRFIKQQFPTYNLWQLLLLANQLALHNLPIARGRADEPS
ncbi:hypothetical protein IMCC3135_18595 [Granulosicoccus antarcticus IMCC3135]|uniref:Uncharacterized protein n=1 Tax=Granulosicoccus antarcticus IMCC3135 TaxID=1192854 RepID=A0A2Z2NVP6_9GAMM|nr:hypothetical protein IMCC3135_18595 [Granulosicoccus antarcticus IMCC3135]